MSKLSHEEKMAELDRLSYKQRTAEQKLLTRLQHHLVGRKLDGNLTDGEVKLILAYNEYVTTRQEVSQAITDLELPMDDGGDLNVVVRSAGSREPEPKGGLN